LTVWVDAQRQDSIRFALGWNLGAKGKVMFPTPQPATMTTTHEPNFAEKRKIMRSFKV
jgi:hypothetical protein